MAVIMQLVSMCGYNNLHSSRKAFYKILEYVSKNISLNGHKFLQTHLKRSATDVGCLVGLTSGFEVG